MLSTIKSAAVTALAALLLAACSNPRIQPIATDSANETPRMAVSIPDCVLAVDPGKIKKCRPQLVPDSRGIEGKIQVDGVRPHRNWAPMVAFELTSEDGDQVLRFTFRIQEYQLDAGGQAGVAKTPFSGVAEQWNNREQDWSLPLHAEILPATPYEFRVVWNDDTTVTFTLGAQSWKSVPLDFKVAQVAVTGSGVMVSTSELSVLNR